MATIGDDPPSSDAPPGDPRSDLSVTAASQGHEGATPTTPQPAPSGARNDDPPAWRVVFLLLTGPWSALHKAAAGLSLTAFLLAGLLLLTTHSGITPVLVSGLAVSVLASIGKHRGHNETGTGSSNEQQISRDQSRDGGCCCLRPSECQGNRVLCTGSSLQHGVPLGLRAVIIALGVIGLAVSGAGVELGTWIAGLFSG